MNCFGSSLRCPAHNLEMDVVIGDMFECRCPRGDFYTKVFLEQLTDESAHAIAESERTLELFRTRVIDVPVVPKAQLLCQQAQNDVAPKRILGPLSCFLEGV